jgi:hypothetical protein
MLAPTKAAEPPSLSQRAGERAGAGGGRVGRVKPKVDMRRRRLAGSPAHGDQRITRLSRSRGEAMVARVRGELPWSSAHSGTGKPLTFAQFQDAVFWLCPRGGPFRVTGSCDWLLRLALATGSCDWLLRLALATGSCDWLLRLAATARRTCRPLRDSLAIRCKVLARLEASRRGDLGDGGRGTRSGGAGAQNAEVRYTSGKPQASPTRGCSTRVHGRFLPRQRELKPAGERYGEPR